MPLTVVEAVVTLASFVDEFCVYALQSSSTLAHPVRRRVLSVLIDRGVVRREALAESIAADGSIAPDDRGRVEIALHHEHLPKLEDGQLIEYDHRNGDVVLWADPDAAAELLDSA